MPTARHLSLFFAVALLAGCGSTVKSSLTVDGEPYHPSECRSGQGEEFFGVDLRDDSGRMLRLLVEPDHSGSAFYFADENGSAVDFTRCVDLSIERSDNDKYGQYTVDGAATVDCERGLYRIRGAVDFDGCAFEY